MCLDIKVNFPHLVLAEGVENGYEWVVTHNDIGYRCGYVRVPKGHPWHGQDYNDIDANVHGGLTFARPDIECGKGGEDDAWWVGFDCAHCYDAVDPELLARSSKGTEGQRLYDLYTQGKYSFLFRSDELRTIKTQEYVEKECRELCHQAFEAAKQTN